MNKLGSFIFASLFLLYFVPSLVVPFFWDDYALIKENTYLEDPWNLLQVLTNPKIMSGYSDTGFDQQTYRPLRTAYFIIVVTLFGKSTIVFHFFNVTLHCLVTFLFYRRMQAFSGVGKFLPALISLIFLFHPIHLETINTINACGDLHGTLFFLLAWEAFSKHPLRTFDVVTTGLLCFLGMLSKEMFITAPLLLFLLGDREKAVKWRTWLFLLSFSAGYFVLRQSVMLGLAQIEMPLSFGQHFLYVLQTCFSYLFNFFLPLDLALLYRIPTSNILIYGSFALFLAILACLGFFGEKYAKALPAFSAFWISLFPISNAILINTFINDRLFYFPSLLLLWALFLFFQETNCFYFPKLKRFGVGLGCSVLVCVYLHGFHSNVEWTVPARLWQKTWKKTEIPAALWNMVCAFAEEYRYPEMLEYFDKNPQDLNTPYVKKIARNLCLAALFLGQEQKAWMHYQILYNAAKNALNFSNEEKFTFLRTLSSLNTPIAKAILESEKIRGL